MASYENSLKTEANTPIELLNILQHPKAIEDEEKLREEMNAKSEQIITTHQSNLKCNYSFIKKANTNSIDSKFYPISISEKEAKITKENDNSTEAKVSKRKKFSSRFTENKINANENNKKTIIKSHTLCKCFNDNSYCPFGKNCRFSHIIKHKRYVTYKYLLKNRVKKLKNELLKPENVLSPMIYLLNEITKFDQIAVPRLKVFEELTSKNKSKN